MSIQQLAIHSDRSFYIFKCGFGLKDNLSLRNAMRLSKRCNSQPEMEKNTRIYGNAGKVCCESCCKLISDILFLTCLIIDPCHPEKKCQPIIGDNTNYLEYQLQHICSTKKIRHITHIWCT